MADKRISQLVARTDIANNDVVPIVANGATTTNKATISSIQEFMQENLDLGVTSVGITLGTTGTDVNVTGSPITTSGNITINIPSASATARGVVTTGTQTFAGYKIFTGTIGVNNDIQLATQGTALNTFIKNVNAAGVTSIGANGFGFNNSNNIYFSGSEKGGGIFAFSNTGNQTYTLQNASGTLAFTSDIPSLAGYVPYTGATANLDLGQFDLFADTIRVNGSSPTSGSYLGFKHATTVTTGETGYTSMYTFGTNIIGYKSVSGATNIDFSFDMSSITPNVSGGRVYTLPDASGTLALTSDLAGYVTLGTTQTITGQKTFSTSGGSDTAIINHGSGSGIALNITKGGNNEALRVAKTSGSGNAVTITGGLLSAEAATLTGALNGTSASFTGTLSAGQSTFTHADTPLRLNNAGGQFTQLDFQNNGTQKAAIWWNNTANSLNLFSGVTALTIASTGAATFSGALNGTSATFFLPSTNSGAVLNIGNVGSGVFGGLAITDGGTYPMKIWGGELQFLTGSSILGSATTKLTIASTGAATFSSSVTAASGNINGLLSVAAFTDSDLSSSPQINLTRTAAQFTGIAIRGSVAADRALFSVGSDDALHIGRHAGGGGAWTKQVSFLDNGNVGIGTASPSAPLTITSNASGDNTRLIGRAADGFSFLTFRNNADTTTNGNIGVSDSQNMIFYTSTTERMRITSGGSVQIGTSSGSGAKTFIYDNRSNSTSLDEAALYVRQDGTNPIQTWSAGGGFERMRITSGGNVLINRNTLSSSGVSTTGTLQVNTEIISTGALGGLFWENRSGGVTSNSNWYGWYTTGGTIFLFNGAANVASINPATGVYTPLSDENKKKDFEESTIGLNQVLNLKPTLYRMKDDESEGEKELGFIAQEVKEFIPQAYVEGGEEDAKFIGLNYNAIVAALVKSVQELKEEIDSLKNQIK